MQQSNLFNSSFEQMNHIAQEQENVNSGYREKTLGPKLKFTRAHYGIVILAFLLIASVVVGSSIVKNKKVVNDAEITTIQAEKDQADEELAILKYRYQVEEIEEARTLTADLLMLDLERANIKKEKDALLKEIHTLPNDLRDPQSFYKAMYDETLQQYSVEKTDLRIAPSPEEQEGSE